MADKLRTQQELERLQSKFIGTGHPDTTSWEWKTNIHRDTYASIVGHPPMLAYIALAENEPVHLVRARLIRKMLQPAGAPPQRDNERCCSPLVRRRSGTTNEAEEKMIAGGF
ncbi:hypothetical protein HYQ46_003427 [Verticillium longisporum]|nr:hypothetical protein HYQ46_003427 [Verticillium longisporum]